MPKALVVDDEPFLILLLTDEIEAAGFEVRSAFNADEALALLESEGDWDLLITDIRMPGALDGWELGRRAKARFPHLRLIYASAVAPAPAALAEHEAFLAKPYERADLTRVLASIGIIDDQL